MRGQGKKKKKKEHMLLSILLMARCNIHDSELKIIINKKGLTRTPCSEVRQY